VLASGKPVLLARWPAIHAKLRNAGTWSKFTDSKAHTPGPNAPSNSINFFFLRITSNISSMFVSSRKEISVTVHFVLVKRNTDINHLGEEKWHGTHQ
jgi:hypothetical protein